MNNFDSQDFVSGFIDYYKGRSEMTVFDIVRVCIIYKGVVLQCLY